MTVETLFSVCRINPKIARVELVRRLTLPNVSMRNTPTRAYLTTLDWTRRMQVLWKNF